MSEFEADQGDDWDELERKAAKCTYLCVLARFGLVLTGSCFCVAADSKRMEAAKARGESDGSDDGRSKKKGGATAKGAKGKANAKWWAFSCVEPVCLALHWLHIFSFLFCNNISDYWSSVGCFQNVDAGEN